MNSVSIFVYDFLIPPESKRWYNVVMDKLSYDGPIVLVVLDGVGLAPDSPGNAVSKARTPFLGKAARDYLHVALNASGKYVGLVPGQVGNSEIGHNTLGAGQIIKQDFLRVNEAFEDGSVFETDAWKEAVKRVTDSGTLHFSGIFSDGGVHSHISHLEQMIERAYLDGVRRMRVHAILDGRDTPPQSEPKYIRRFEKFAERFSDADIKIASGGGRQTTVADRYENDWSVVARGWDMMVNAQADYYFKSAEEAIEMLRRITPGIQDQDLPAFVIVDEKERPVGKVEKGDSFIYFDFRKDRAIEIAQAFTYWDFPYFNRGDYKPDDVYFVGMMEYNSDTHVPEHRLVEPIKIDHPLNNYLAEKKISDFAVSETIKFGHITYYFNGNSYNKAEKEEFLEIEGSSDAPTARPWMMVSEITNAVLENMDKYKFIRANFANGDIVGHTADMDATIVAMEAVDLSLKRIAAEVDKLGGALVIVADHGNAEELLDEYGQPKTAHTLNKVPFIIYDNTINRSKYVLGEAAYNEPGLSNVASTVALLLGLSDYPKEWDAPLIKIK